MADKVFGFSEESFRRVREATRRVLGSPRTGSQRRRQVPVVGGGGGEKKCDDRNEIWQFTIFGSPTGGSFDLRLNIRGEIETLTFDWDFDSDDAKAEFETHSEIGSGDIETGVGQFPDQTIVIEFTGDLEFHRIPTPSVDFSGLTGGTGVGVIVSRWQPGYPEDAGEPAP